MLDFFLICVCGRQRGDRLVIYRDYDVDLGFRLRERGRSPAIFLAQAAFLR